MEGRRRRREGPATREGRDQRRGLEGVGLLGFGLIVTTGALGATLAGTLAEEVLGAALAGGLGAEVADGGPATDSDAGG